MSKDFEKEYRELAQNEIPDLWDRIEAGLTEKSTPEVTVVNYRTATKKNVKVTRFLKKYAGLAAAILCVALIIPASNFILHSGDKSSSGASSAPQEAYGTANGAANDMAYDTTTSEAESEEASEAAAEETTDDAADGVAAELSEVAEAANVGAAEEELESATDRAETDRAETGGTAEDAGAKSKEEMKEMDTASPLLTNVVVRMSEKKKDIYTEDGKRLSGTVYTVIVCEDVAGILDEGGQIEIFWPADIADEMAVKGELEMDLICESSGDYDYVVNKVYP